MLGTAGPRHVYFAGVDLAATHCGVTSSAIFKSISTGMKVAGVHWTKANGEETSDQHLLQEILGSTGQHRRQVGVLRLADDGTQTSFDKFCEVAAEYGLAENTVRLCIRAAIAKDRKYKECKWAIRPGPKKQ